MFERLENDNRQVEDVSFPSFPFFFHSAKFRLVIMMLINNQKNEILDCLFKRWQQDSVDKRDIGKRKISYDNFEMNKVKN